MGFFIRLKIRYGLGLSGTYLGTPFRGFSVGLKSWHSKTLGTNQDFSCHSPYRPNTQTHQNMDFSGQR